MNAGDFKCHIAPAVASVLESMFFSEAEGTCEPSRGIDDVRARVPFSGEVCGVLGVRISESSARGLAASFLGEAEELLSEAQIAQVICELANILCGWIVSKEDWGGVWELGSPELLSAEEGELEGVQESFALEGGNLTISLSLSVLV